MFIEVNGKIVNLMLADVIESMHDGSLFVSTVSDGGSGTKVSCPYHVMAILDFIKERQIKVDIPRPVVEKPKKKASKK